MEAYEKLTLLLLFTIGMLIVTYWMYKSENKQKDIDRKFMGMDVEEYIKTQVGEEYYNKNYKK